MSYIWAAHGYLKMNMRKLLLGIITILALMTQAGASSIAQCKMKSWAEVKTLPVDKGHVIWNIPQELPIEVIEEHGDQWSFVTSTDPDNPATGWVRRSSLSKCLRL